MSEYFQSFVYSEKFLENLENSAINKKQNSGKTNLVRSKTSDFTIEEDKDNQSLEAIEESPTNTTTQSRSIRDRLKHLKAVKASQSRTRRLEKKSKSSDSVFQTRDQHNNEPKKQTNEALSIFFESSFDFSVGGGLAGDQKTVGEVNDTNPKILFDIPVQPEFKSDLYTPSKSIARIDGISELAGCITKVETPARGEFDDMFEDSFNYNSEALFNQPILEDSAGLNENLQCSENVTFIKATDHPDAKKFLEQEMRSQKSLVTNSEELQVPGTSNEDQVDPDLFDESFNFNESHMDTDNVSFVQKENDLEVSDYIESEMKLHKSLVTTTCDVFEESNASSRLSTFQNSTVKQSNESLVVDTSKNLQLIENWNLPISVANEYKKKGVDEMFLWQCECLKNQKVLFDGSNLVYSAPTSAGKTLVSEILMIKNIIERKKKALFILPFVSVVREKMFYLQDLLQSSGIRVEGFFGGYHPAGTFDSINLAVCTIEKANAIVNKMMEQNKLSDIGMIVIDEVHLISDKSRGYILELLLTKILYTCKMKDIKIQIVTMSATLPNLEVLTNWLEAEFYFTDFRPIDLHEMIKVNKVVYDNQMKVMRTVKNEYAEFFKNDSDDISQLCMETLLDNCQLIIFCPSKEWCENLAKTLAEGLRNMIRQKKEFISDILNMEKIQDLHSQFKSLPTGVDSMLELIMRFGVAFHHAGLTTDERDLIEMGFKEGILRILVATSTLSSGVNLPARRVIIRSPMFAGKMMSNLTYKQMIGRAGRKGKDVLGESILICNDTNLRYGKQLITARLDPIQSCLNADNNANMKRALLEIISSGVATTKSDIELFINSTLYYKQNEKHYKFFSQDEQKLKDLISKNKKITTEILQENQEEGDSINDSINFLLEYEFIRLTLNTEKNELNFVPTRLGMACLSSSMPPTDGFLLFSELQKARQNFVLESELHAIYLVTPYSVGYQLANVDWILYFEIWERLPPTSKRVGKMIGISEGFFVKVLRSAGKLDYKTMQIHKRFYTALALQELVNESPIDKVAEKYKINRGLLQSLQQTSSTFAGIVTTFCKSLNWDLLALILGQFKERLYFGIHPDLIDLMRLPNMNCLRARALFKSGIEKLNDLANSTSLTVENILLNALDFDSDKKRDNENEYEANQRLKARKLFVTGKSAGISMREAAKMFIEDARKFVELDLGTNKISWSTEEESNDKDQDQDMLETAPGPSETVNNSKKRRPDTSIINNSTETPLKKSKLSSTKESPSKYRRKLRSSKSPKKPKVLVSSEEITSSQDLPEEALKVTQRFNRMITQKAKNTTQKEAKDATSMNSNLMRKPSDFQVPDSSDNSRAVPDTLEKTSSDSSKILQGISGISDISDGNVSMFQNSLVVHPNSSSSSDSSQFNTTVVKNYKNFLKKITVSDPDLLKKFTEDISAATEISMAIGIGVVESTKSVIGSNLLRNQNQAVANKESHKFVFDSRFFIASICMTHEKNQIWKLNLKELSTKDITDFLRDFLSRNDVVLTIYEAKEQLKILYKVFPDIGEFAGKIMDPQIANWMLDPDSVFSRDSCLTGPTWHQLVETYAGDYEKILNMAGNISGASSLALNYRSKVDPEIRAEVESYLSGVLIKEQLKKMEPSLARIFKDLEMPTQHVLAKMEVIGFPVNGLLLCSKMDDATSLRNNLEQKIFQLSNKKFDLQNTDQIKKVLSLPKNGSTSKKVLDKMDNPIAKLISQWRTLSTTITNMEIIKNCVKNDRIYAKNFSFNITGRIQSNDPNLQNVTKDFTVEFEDVRGKSIKELISFKSSFGPSNGKILLSADFCQLEFRILTHLCKDKSLVSIMHTNGDIFRKIAAKWHKKEESAVTELLRNQTKQICYGVIYGMGTAALADELNVEKEEAVRMLEEFHATYPGIKAYTDKIVKTAREKGFIETLTGRRRNMPTINSTILKDRNQAERRAFNTTVQGTASDIAKCAILKMEKHIKSKGLANDVNIVLQMHDELIYEVSPSVLNESAKLLKNCMEKSVTLSIPFRVKVKSGMSWGQMEEIEVKD